MNKLSPRPATAAAVADTALGGPGPSIDDGIMLLREALPATVCDELLAEFAGSDEWNAAVVSSGRSDMAVRNAHAISFSERTVVDRNRHARTRINEALFKQCATVVQQYNRRFPHCQVSRDFGFDLLRYQAGGFYREHTDSDHTNPRELACSFLINDDFTGGEFAFFGGRRVVTMRRGDAVLFPSNFMYPHQVLPVTSGTRYAVVTWFV